MPGAYQAAPAVAAAARDACERAPSGSGTLRLAASRRQPLPHALVDRAPRVELGGDVGAADQRRRRRRPPRARPRASRRGSWPAQTTIVSTASVRASPPTRTCRPASSMRSYVTPGSIVTPALGRSCGGSSRWSSPSAGADLARLALQQRRPRAATGAARRGGAPGRRGARRRGSMPHSARKRSDGVAGSLAVGEQLGDVEADAARADDRDAPAGRRGARSDDVGVAQHLGWSMPGIAGVARRTPVASDDAVEARRGELVRGRAVAEPDVDAERGEARAGSSAASRRTPPCPGLRARQVELPADLGGRPRTASRGGRARPRCTRRRGRPGRRRRRRSAAARAPAATRQLGLAAGARVDEAGAGLSAEDVVEAGLVAGDAGVDLVGAARGGLAARARGRRGTAAPSRPGRRRRGRGSPRRPRAC